MHLKNMALGFLAATTMFTLGTGCSGGGSSASGSSGVPLSITGGFASISLAALQPENGLYTPMAATDYTMVCSMLVDPFTSDSKALDSAGKFSLSIAGAAGKPIGCFLTKSGKIAAVIEFTAASSGFSGAAGGSAFNPNGDSTSLTLPTTLAISNGVVAVDTTAIVQDGTTAVATAWSDPTGTWSITGACQNGFDKDSGTYKSECQTGAGGGAPTSVYFKQVGATNGGSSKTGLSIWADAASRAACGNVEGPVNLESGWSATGGWNTAFTGTGSFNLATLGAVATSSSLAVAQSWGGTTVCGATVPTPGTSKCADVVFTGAGTTWGMTDNACKLYCVLSAIQNNRPDENQITYDFGSATCPLRYRMNHQFQNEFANDKDYNPMNGAPSPGAFNGGICASGANKCANGGNTITLLEPDERGPSSRFMFGELFINANVGTLVQKEHFTANFQNQAMNGSISCGGSRIEKFTMIQESATKGTVTVEHAFVPDLTNNSECASNSNFMQMSSDESTMTLKLSKQ